MVKIKHMKSAIEWDVPRTFCGMKITKTMQTIENSYDTVKLVTCKKCIRLLRIHGAMG